MRHNKNSKIAKGQSRRDFLKINAVAGAGLLMPWVARGDHDGPLKKLPKLDATTIPKYQSNLIVPPTMPATAPNYYELAIRQFEQQILPSGYPKTLVAGYGSANHAGTLHTPAFTIETAAGATVRVKWINGQVDASGNFLPHVLADELFPDHVMWANPPGPRDEHGQAFAHNPYFGPVPIVTHLHGGATVEQSDGHPLAWYLPAANNIPAGFYTEGTLFEEFQGLPSNGSATFEYSGNNVATMLWCHDHTLGITEYNVYAGFAGAFMVRGGAFDLPAGALPSGAYEIPLVVQDRAFKPDGSLLFHNGEHAGDGDTIIVNGQTWPKLEVEQRRYRFRILNGCNNVNIALQFSIGLPLWVIGGDIGFVPQPVAVRSLPLTNAERADVIVDFTNVAVGTEFLLLNRGGDFRSATTGQVMQLKVVARTSADNTTPPGQLGTLPVQQLTAPRRPTRRLAILDERQGIIDVNGNPISLEFEDPVTETPERGTTEIWEFYGFNSHPMHLHAARFQILDRAAFGGSRRPAKPWERGIKDTVDIHESGVTRVLVQFDDHLGKFVWHCHLLRHEDVGMMRPMELRERVP